MKHISHIILIFTSILWANDIVAQMPQRIPLTERVNIQMDSARTTQIIDGQWVAVGTNKTHTIQKDFGILFDGKPSYRFELKKEDNTLSGYSKEKPREGPNYPIVMRLTVISANYRILSIRMHKR